MRSVITSAEPFGFGPVSKLRSVGALLSSTGWELEFAGSGTALTYLQREGVIFRGLTELREPTDLLHLEAGRYDMALSVMDPFLAVWALHNGLPCVYVDSLFWFWDWADQQHLRDAWSTVTPANSTLPEALELLRHLPMPVAEYVGHRSASVSCVQRTRSTPSGFDVVGDIGPVVPTGAIVDLSRRRDAPRKLWTVSLSGLLNPLIGVEEAMLWADATLRLVDEAFVAVGVPDARVCLTGNAEVVGRMKHIPRRFDFAERAAGAVLDLFNSAHACLTPPGLTTILECLAYDCPVIALPPQHYAHERILDEFSTLRTDAFPHSATAEMLGVDIVGDAAIDTQRLIRTFHDRVGEQGDAWNLMVASVACTLRLALDSRETLLARQRSVVTSFVHGFSGAQEVARAFDDLAGREAASC